MGRLYCPLAAIDDKSMSPENGLYRALIELGPYIGRLPYTPREARPPAFLKRKVRAPVNTFPLASDSLKHTEGKGLRRKELPAVWSMMAARLLGQTQVP